MQELISLKYTSNGEERELRITNEACLKWKYVVDLISDDINRIAMLEEQYQGRPQDCLRQALIDDFINKKPRNYSQDWNGLIELLQDVGLESLAERVKYALTAGM